MRIIFMVLLLCLKFDFNFEQAYIVDSSNYDNQNNEESESTESNDDYDTR